MYKLWLTAKLAYVHGYRRRFVFPISKVCFVCIFFRYFFNDGNASISNKNVEIRVGAEKSCIKKWSWKILRSEDKPKVLSSALKKVLKNP